MDLDDSNDGSAAIGLVLASYKSRRPLCYGWFLAVEFMQRRGVGLRLWRCGNSLEVVEGRCYRQYRRPSLHSRGGYHNTPSIAAIGGKGVCKDDNTNSHSLTL